MFSTLSCSFSLFLEVYPNTYVQHFYVYYTAYCKVYNGFVYVGLKHNKQPEAELCNKEKSFFSSSKRCLVVCLLYPHSSFSIMLFILYNHYSFGNIFYFKIIIITITPITLLLLEEVYVCKRTLCRRSLYNNLLFHVW